MVNGVECQNTYLPSKKWGENVLEISLWHETPEEKYAVVCKMHFPTEFDWNIPFKLYAVPRTHAGEIKTYEKNRKNLSKSHLFAMLW